MTAKIMLLLFGTGLLIATSWAHEVPEDAEIHFVEPKDGAILSNPVRVRMSVEGFGVAPVGENKHKAGHHHLLIDVDNPPLEGPVPADEHHLHFDGGEQTAEIDLPPGEHSLQLLLGDEEHETFYPPLLSKRIRIVVTN